MAPRLSVSIESWPISGGFTISRGTKTEAVVVVAQIEADGAVGRGECVPYARYGETPDAVYDAIVGVGHAIGRGIGRDELADLLPAGAARNAVDCALWDFEAKRSGKRAFRAAGLAGLRPVTTAYTLSLGPTDAMAAAARKARHRPLLKIKLGGEGDEERLIAVRENAPDSSLIVDANEAWTPNDLERLLYACASAGVDLVEQPLPAGADDALADIERPIPVCADESVHDLASLPALASRYDAINIKLDKTGGLTGALALSQAAREEGYRIMVGCMLATSLAMAPALLVAQHAEWVDLDGPLLLARDREPRLEFDGSLVHPSEPALWG